MTQITLYAQQSAAAGRHIMPDLVRAFAVLGIVLVNVAYFAYPGEVTYHDGGLRTHLDNAAYFVVNSVFLFKSYTLFSFMFGVGVAYQMTSAQRRSVGFGRRYSRRLLGLLLLGIAHVSFAFVGDILIVYAVFGALLYLFRNRSIKALKGWAFGLMIFQTLLVFAAAAGFYAWHTFDPDDVAKTVATMQEGFSRYREIYGNGTFAEIMALRWSDWSGYVLFSIPIQGPLILSFFIWGLIAVKTGVLTDPKADIWRKARRVYLPIGIILNLTGAYMMYMGKTPMSSEEMLGTALIVLGSPFSTLGYLGLIAKWVDTPDSGLKIFMARGGTATLSAYLLQSIILSLVFTGYGLGQYGQITAFGCIMIALVVGIVSLIFVSLWRKHFAYGPFEFMLRRFTYWGDNR